MKKEINKSSKNEIPKNAVMYTRVATKEQNGYSLSAQRQVCSIIQYAKKHKYKIMGHFGGVYPASERKEFNNMLLFIKESNTPIRYVLAEDPSRLSREISDMVSLLNELESKGIKFRTIDKRLNKILRNKKKQYGLLYMPMISHDSALNPNGKVRPKGKTE